jgi:hypothetical protein
MRSPLLPHISRRLSLCAICVIALPLALGGRLRAQAPASPQTPASRATISGTVADPTGAIVSGATVQLLRAGGAPIATVLTDSSGTFHLPQPAPGDYRLSVQLPGFAPLLRPLHIARSPLAPLALTLDLASVASSVTVSADQDLALSDPAANTDAATVSAADIKDLPIFDGDIVATLSAFLDAGASGEGGATLIIDGVEAKSVGVSPSAIERVSINQDPYSAQYRNPGRGQVELITKSAADHFHGSFSFTFRDSALNATNYFSTSKSFQQRRLYEGYLTGPVAHLPSSSFLFSATRKESDYQTPVDATPVPVPTPAQNVPDPGSSTNLTLKLAHQFNDRHSAYLLYRFFDANNHNANVGGQVQPSAGYSAYNFDMDLTYHDDLTLSAHALNQFNLLFERNLDRNVSNNPSPQIQVEGVATFGGAQADVYNTENNPNLSDIFDLTLSSHIPQELKFGIQVPNLGRRILDDRTNRQGTYVFSSAAAYIAGTPSAFSLQQGQSRFETLYAQPGSFILDQIQLTPSLTVIPGLRYDFQNAIPQTKDGFEPHLSITWVIEKKHALVLRTGTAVYIRRIGVNVGQQLARYSNAAERSLLLTTNLCYPIAACNPLAAQPPNLFLYQPGLQSPVQGYFGLSLERQITRQSTLSLGYQGYRGWHALRSVDINAPLPPFTSAARPNPSYAQILQLQSAGYQKTDDLSLSYRGRIGRVYSGFLQYNWQHADSNTQYSTFFPQNQYDPNNEWARFDQDQRQRLSLFGTFYPDKPFTLGLGFYNNTPLPYTITTGIDDYHTGLFNARPAGVPRNSLNGGSYQDLQVRLGYTRLLHPTQKDNLQGIALSLSSFNTLNRANFTTYVGVLTSPEFRQPTAASDPRRLQLSASFTF